MKKILFKVFAILIVMLFNSCAMQRQVSAQPGNVNFQVFYDELSPYGQWVNYPNYGYVWIPDVGTDFAPYQTAGYWVFTDYGWTWVSDYAWGWAPFHYGRWDYDNNFGWFWVPDNEWGPAWVTWRRGESYYGWSPMRPGISINLSFGNDYRDVDHWYFVHDRDFGRPHMERYYVNRRDNDMIIRNTTVINNTYIDKSRNVTYISGPRRDDVQKYSGRSFSSVKIRDNDKPGERLNNKELDIYRPRVEKIDNGNRKPIPSRMTDPKDVKPAGRRTPDNKPNTATPPSQNSRRTEQPSQPPKQQQQQQQKMQQQNQVQQQQQRQKQQQNDQQKLQQQQQLKQQQEQQQQQQQQEQRKQQQNDQQKLQQQQQQQQQKQQQGQQQQRQQQQQQQQKQIDVPKQQKQPKQVQPKQQTKQRRQKAVNQPAPKEKQRTPAPAEKEQR
jgi:DNA segregation ATPase FtsK/SpoIIIE-like protein